MVVEFLHKRYMSIHFSFVLRMLVRVWNHSTPFPSPELWTFATPEEHCSCAHGYKFDQIWTSIIQISKPNQTLGGCWRMNRWNNCKVLHNKIKGRWCKTRVKYLIIETFLIVKMKTSIELLTFKKHILNVNIEMDHFLQNTHYV